MRNYNNFNLFSHLFSILNINCDDKEQDDKNPMEPDHREKTI